MIGAGTAHKIMVSMIVCMYICTIEMFHTAFGEAFHVLKRAWTCRRLAGFAYIRAYAGRTSPQAGHRASPPRVRSRQARTVPGTTNEKVRVASRKGPRSVESVRISTPMIARFWICYSYIYICTLYGVYNMLHICVCAEERRHTE